MKKIISSFLVLIIMTSCVFTNNKKNISIISPSGAPALSLIDVVDDELVNIDIVDGSEVLQSEFVNGNADIIIAPINLGVKLSNQTGNYKLEAVTTSGNLFLVSTNKELKNGKIAGFGEAAVPGKLINYLSNELSNYDFEWFNGVSEAASSLLAGEYEGALLAEPILTSVKIKSDKEIYEIIDIQELYKQKTGLSFYPQSAIFVKANSSNDTKKILKTIENSISTYNNDVDKLKERLEKIDLKKLGIENSKVIVEAYQSMGLLYANARENIEIITSFLELFGIDFNKEILN